MSSLPILGLLLLVPLLLWLRQNMVVVLGLSSAWLYYFGSQGEIGNTALDVWQNARSEVFLAIPLYVLAGNVMAQGSIAARLIRVMSALTAPIPGGLALAAVLSCALFAAISGSSTVTMLAVGGVLFPALLKAGYQRNFSLGLLCAAGTLGIIIPPSIPMILYGIMTTVSITDLFKAGIARSGAYNRSLTPFGFQSERRSLWEAREVYLKLSPFLYANQIKEPLLLIHGEADNNSGTFPIQTERLYQALAGNGGTVRYVSLPHEAHGYSARESVGHVQWEMSQWLKTQLGDPRQAH